MNYNAEILSIGNELLIGKTINTNATWLARKLTILGYNVKRIIVVPDDIDEIVNAIHESLSRKPKVIIMTGGLGPTYDDKTSEALAKALNKPWVINEGAFEMVKRKYDKMGLEMTQHRLKMAKMPKGSKALPNPVGTAPGILIENNGTLIVALPGVPQEMKDIFELHVESILKEAGPKLFFFEKSIIIKGMPESSLAPILDEIMKETPNVYIKSHPSGSESKEPIIEIHFTASGSKLENAKERVEKALEVLVEKIKDKAKILKSSLE